MSLASISDMVPHSGTMSLLDGVLAADAESLSAEVAIRADSMFCQDGKVGAWIGIEYMAQAVAAHAGHCARLRGEPVKLGFLLGSRRYHCAVASFPAGSVLKVHVQRALQGDNGLGAFECRIDDSASGQTLAHATVTVYQPDNVDEFLRRSSNE
jgi:predicted hotdog family 3-hydroxylacyl-ACP dehydratase